MRRVLEEILEEEVLKEVLEEVLEEVVLKEILEEVVLKEILEEVLVEVEHFRKKYGVNKTNSEFRIAISVGGIQILI